MVPIETIYTPNTKFLLKMYLRYFGQIVSKRKMKMQTNNCLILIYQWYNQHIKFSLVIKVVYKQAELPPPSDQKAAATTNKQKTTTQNKSPAKKQQIPPQKTTKTKQPQQKQQKTYTFQGCTHTCNNCLVFTIRCLRNSLCRFGCQQRRTAVY